MGEDDDVSPPDVVPGATTPLLELGWFELPAVDDATGAVPAVFETVGDGPPVSSPLVPPDEQWEQKYNWDKPRGFTLTGRMTVGL